MTSATPAIRDVVLPIFLGAWNDNNFEYQTITGTTFSIGKRGVAPQSAQSPPMVRGYPSAFWNRRSTQPKTSLSFGLPQFRIPLGL